MSRPDLVRIAMACDLVRIDEAIYERLLQNDPHLTATVKASTEVHLGAGEFGTIGTEASVMLGIVAITDHYDVDECQEHFYVGDDRAFQNAAEASGAEVIDVTERSSEPSADVPF